MKKYLIALLALVMMFALAIPVFAVEPEGEVNQDVTAGYVAAEDIDGGKVYRVTIAWQANAGEPALTYTGEKTTYTWNTESLNYEASTTAEAGWTGSTGYTVKVTNYSNAEVNASVAASNNYDLTLEATGATSATLGSAAEDIHFTDTDTTGEAKSATFTYTYSANDDASAPTDVETSVVTIGTITVTIGE